MPNPLRNPKSAVGRQSGSGKMNPYDKEFQTIRNKVDAVLEGREKFTYQEIGYILARLLKEY